MCSALHLICNETFFAIPIDSLVEVIDQVDIDPIPTMSLDIKGVFYYRGKIVPLIDLRYKLFQSKELSQSARVVILQHKGFFTALYVDQIRMIVEYDRLRRAENIDETIEKYIDGVFQENNLDYFLLNIDRLVGI
ncbi:MAG: CheW domain-containing protein [Candidatus Cloacimonetes bacterium]|nr:CheW domain-containing protein [Candidatus Cloacimonadota bacterium]